MWRAAHVLLLGMLPAVLSLLICCRAHRARTGTLPGDSDNDFVKETAFCPNKTLWERDAAVSLLTEIDNSSVPIHLLR